MNIFEFKLLIQKFCVLLETELVVQTFGMVLHPSWMQCSRCVLRRAEQTGTVTSLDLLVARLCMQPRVHHSHVGFLRLKCTLPVYIEYQLIIPLNLSHGEHQLSTPAVLLLSAKYSSRFQEEVRNSAIAGCDGDVRFNNLTLQAENVVDFVGLFIESSLTDAELGQCWTYFPWQASFLLHRKTAKIVSLRRY